MTTLEKRGQLRNFGVFGLGLVWTHFCEDIDFRKFTRKIILPISLLVHFQTSISTKTNPQILEIPFLPPLISTYIITWLLLWSIIFEDYILGGKFSLLVQILGYPVVFYLHVHTLFPIAGCGFDSMLVYWSFAFHLICWQNCSFLTRIQSLECS